MACPDFDVLADCESEIVIDADPDVVCPSLNIFSYNPKTLTANHK
jgi:hypothetical protein